MAATSPARVLLVDDDVELTTMLTDYLETEGFRIEAVFDGEAGARAAISGRFDAIILDVMLPGISGTEVLRRIRQTSMVPVIMLTAKGDDVERVVGLELGADDYVAKPYFPRELVARLRAVLRRHAAQLDPVAMDAVLGVGVLQVDPAARRALHAGRAIELTVCEFDLLVALLRSGDRVATKDQLSLDVLGRARESYDRSIDVHVSKLRQKLVGVGCATIEIETVRGIGYRLREIR